MREEIVKSWKSIFIPILCLGCILFNGFFLLSKWNQREYISRINNMAWEIGLDITDRSITAYRNYWKKDSRNMSVQWDTLEHYIKLAPELFRHVEVSQLAYDYISDNHLADEAARYALERFKELEGRVNEINDTKESAHLFLPANISFFTFISKYLLLMAVESVVISILMTVKTVHFEKNNQTEAIIYTTKTGRDIIKGKLGAVLLNSFLITAFLCAIALILLNLFYPLVHLMGTPVSSGMIDLAGSVCIGNWNMTLGFYLFLSYITTAGLTLVFAMAAFFTAVIIQNSFLTFLILAGTTAVVRIIGLNMPTSVNAYFFEKYNPLDCLMQAGRWFLNGTTQLSLPFYEGGTILLWWGITLGSCIAAIRRFKHQEI